MASTDDLAGAACPPSSSSPPPSGGPLLNEDRSTSTIDVGRREQLRGLGKQLIRSNYYGPNIMRGEDFVCAWSDGEDSVCAWSDVFSDLLANVDPDLHDTLHPYHDHHLLEIHGEKLMDIAIRLASPQQWLRWIRPSAFLAALTGASGVFLRLFASWGGPVDDGTMSGLLRSAAEGGSVDILSALIAAGAGPLVQMVDEERCPLTTLRMAADRGYRSFVAKLIEAGAPVEAKGFDGETALTEAVRHRHKGVVLELLAAGADVNAMVFLPRTSISRAPLIYSDLDPLHIAVQTRDEEMVNILLQAGAAPSKEAMNVLPLHTAALQGSCQIMNSLILAGARVDTVDTSGRSALHLACAYSQLDAVDILLRHKASAALLNNGGLSPMDLVGARVLALRQWSRVRARTAPRMRPIAARELEWELWERDVNLIRLFFGSWIAHPSTLNSAETSAVDTICGMLQPFIAWSRRGWLVMMRSRHLAEIVAEQPDRSHADAFALSGRGIVLVQEPSSNTAGLRDKRRSAQALHDGEHSTTDWSAAVTWLLLGSDDSLFRSIVRFL